MNLGQNCNHPVEAKIKQLVEKGTIKLEADGKFRPDDMITRDMEMVNIVE